MILLVIGDFPVYDNGRDTGKTEFVVSHGVDLDTGKNIIMTNEPPHMLGGKFDAEIGEWVIR